MLWVLHLVLKGAIHFHQQNCTQLYLYIQVELQLIFYSGCSIPQPREQCKSIGPKAAYEISLGSHNRRTQIPMTYICQNQANGMGQVTVLGMTYTDIFTRLFRTHSTWDRTSLVLNPCPLLCQGHPCFLSVGIPPRTYCVTISVGQSCLKAFFSDFNAVDKLNEMQIFIANII